MARLRIVDSGVLYRNPLPGHQAVSAVHPFMLPLSQTELICIFRHGQALYSSDGMTHLLRSTDGGRSWQHEGPVRDRKQDTKPYQYGAGCVTRLRDGTLVMLVQRVDRSDPNRLYLNPETGGSLPLETVIFRSSDGGRSWTDPVQASLPPSPPGTEPAAGGAPVELDDGRWLQLFETWNAYDNPTFDIKTFALFSSDQGATWGDCTTVADGSPVDRSYSHGHVIRFANKKLFGVLWAGNVALTEFYDLHTLTSLDETGRRWGAPQPTGIPGQTSYPVELNGGSLAVIYSHRENTDQPGIKVVLSEDAGRSWKLDEHVVVWDAYGKEALGVARSSTYPSSHDAIAYGAPHLAVIGPDQLMASFWCTQSADTHLRYCRLAVE